MTIIKLTKMQGCGNDFVIIDYEEYEKTNMPMNELAKKVCDRNFGVGADGMIIPKIIEDRKAGKQEDRPDICHCEEGGSPTRQSINNDYKKAGLLRSARNDNTVEISQQLQTDKDLLAYSPIRLSSDTDLSPDSPIALSPDISWYFYNSDGSTAQMCGNGIRCFAKYVYDKKIIDKKTFSVLTGAGIIKPELLDDGNVRVNMGTPILEDEKIPFKYPPHSTPLSQGDGVKIEILDREFSITPISMGNPHCVIFTENEPIEDAKKYGPYIEKHEYFPEKTNTEFVRIKSRNEIDLCVYERGCGITLACGTGACASVVAGVLNNLTEDKVKVNLPGGSVFIDWQDSTADDLKDIYMTGPANYSFVAEYML